MYIYFWPNFYTIANHLNLNLNSIKLNYKIIDIRMKNIFNFSMINIK